MQVCIQIGNTDNGLTQQEWSAFCRRLREICEEFGTIHFSGGSASDASWQNYCVCVEVPENLLQFSASVTELRKFFKQDSAAWLQGEAVFI
jgi:hypothetical protein